MKFGSRGELSALLVIAANVAQRKVCTHDAKHVFGSGTTGKAVGPKWWVSFLPIDG